MSSVFETKPSHAPDPVVRDGTPYDPFVLVDDAGERAETDKKADTARTKASDDVDWLSPYMKDLVDHHRPKDGDLDEIGDANKSVSAWKRNSINTRLLLTPWRKWSRDGRRTLSG
jgi:hypothetical protein